MVVCIKYKRVATNKLYNSFFVFDLGMSKKKPGHSSYNATRSHKQSEEAKTDDFNKLYHAQPTRGQKGSRAGNNNSNYNHASGKGSSAQYGNTASYRDDRRDAMNNGDYRAERNDP